MSDAIRVLAVCSVDGSGGGAEKIILRTAAKANPDRLRLTVCVLRHAADDAYDLDVRAAELGIDYCEVVSRSKFDRSVLPRLQQISRSRNAEIVHAHGYKSAFFASRLARSEGITPLSTSHGWTGHHWRERFLYYPADRLIVRKFPLAIAVSNQIRDTLIRWGCKPERVRVVLNGIDPKKYYRSQDTVKRIRDSLGVRRKEIAIGAVGRLEPQKRFDILLDAMKLLMPHRPELRLFIAGEGSLKHELLGQIRRLGLSDRCSLLGHRSDVAELYQGFDVLVQSSDYEGTPTVVVEAMSLQIPVVATDAGGTAELMEHGVHGLIVPMRSPVALASAIKRTLDDRGATAQRVAAGRRRVENELSFDTRMAKLERIYREIVDSQDSSDDRTVRQPVATKYGLPSSCFGDAR